MRAVTLILRVCGAFVFISPNFERDDGISVKKLDENDNETMIAVFQKVAGRGRGRAGGIKAMEQTASADCNMTARCSSGQRQYAQVWRMDDDVMTGEGPAPNAPRRADVHCGPINSVALGQFLA